MTVLMVLQGGPLDGEKQIVQVLPTEPGSLLVFNIPSFQTFAADGETVVDLGLQVNYGFIAQGPVPDAPAGDTWDSSWIFGYVGESYMPTPPDLPDPGDPDVAGNQVAMFVFGNLAVVATKLPGAQLVAESAMVVEGTETPFQWATVSMQAVTVLQGAGTTAPGFGMNGSSGLTAVGTVMSNLLDAQTSSLEDGTVTGWATSYINVAVTNSTAQAAVGTHSMAMKAVAAGDMGTTLTAAKRAAVVAGRSYDIKAQVRAAATGRTCYLFYNWYDSTGANLGSANGPGVADVTTGWTTVGALGIVAPAGAVALDLAPYISGCAINETHYVDDVSIRQGGLP